MAQTTQTKRPRMARVGRMVAHYDPMVDAAYVRLQRAPHGKTVELDDLRRVDLAEDGTANGVELLHCSEGVDVEALPESGAIAEALRELGLPVRRARG